MKLDTEPSRGVMNERRNARGGAAPQAKSREQSTESSTRAEEQSLLVGLVRRVSKLGPLRTCTERCCNGAGGGVETESGRAVVVGLMFAL